MSTTASQAPAPRSASVDRSAKQALARSHREAIRRRTRRIRGTVASVASALFLAAFATVYVQLASGHDPALTANAAKKTAAASTSTSASTASKQSTSASSSSEGSSGSSGSEESSSSASSGKTTSSVTTSQS